MKEAVELMQYTPRERWLCDERDISVLTGRMRFPYASNVNTPNRLMKSAMSEQLGTYDHANSEKSGIPTKELISLYEKYGNGGFGAIVTGCIMIDKDHLEAPGNVIIDKSLDSDERRQAFEEWTNVTKKDGSIFIAQLLHPGRMSMNSKFDVNTISLEEIDAIINQYAYAATFAQQCGFNGVEINAEFSYTLGQLLTVGSNWRTDGYGGTLQNRSCILLKIVREIRLNIRRPSKFVIGIKLFSGNFELDYDIEDFKQFIRSLEKSGYDYISLTGGQFNFVHDLHRKTIDEEELDCRNFYRGTVYTVKRMLTRTKLYMDGGFVKVTDMCDAIDNGWANGISLARSVAGEPDLPKKIIENGVRGAAKSLITHEEYATSQQFAGTQLWQLATGKAVMDSSTSFHLALFKNDLEAHLKFRNEAEPNKPCIVYPKTEIEDAYEEVSKKPESQFEILETTMSNEVDEQVEKETIQFDTAEKVNEIAESSSIIQNVDISIERQEILDKDGEIYSEISANEFSMQKQDVLKVLDSFEAYEKETKKDEIYQAMIDSGLPDEHPRDAKQITYGVKELDYSNLPGYAMEALKGNMVESGIAELKKDPIDQAFETIKDDLNVGGGVASEVNQVMKDDEVGHEEKRGVEDVETYHIDAGLTESTEVICSKPYNELTMEEPAIEIDKTGGSGQAAETIKGTMGENGIAELECDSVDQLVETIKYELNVGGSVVSEVNQAMKDEEVGHEEKRKVEAEETYSIDVGRLTESYEVICPKPYNESTMKEQAIEIDQTDASGQAAEAIKGIMGESGIAELECDSVDQLVETIKYELNVGGSVISEVNQAMKDEEVGHEEKRKVEAEETYSIDVGRVTESYEVICPKPYNESTMKEQAIEIDQTDASGQAAEAIKGITGESGIAELECDSVDQLVEKIKDDLNVGGSAASEVNQAMKDEEKRGVEDVETYHIDVGLTESTEVICSKPYNELTMEEPAIEIDKTEIVEMENISDDDEIYAVIDVADFSSIKEEKTTINQFAGQFPESKLDGGNKEGDASKETVERSFEDDLSSSPAEYGQFACDSVGGKLKPEEEFENVCEASTLSTKHVSSDITYAEKFAHKTIVCTKPVDPSDEIPSITLAKENSREMSNMAVSFISSVAQRFFSTTEAKTPVQHEIYKSDEHISFDESAKNTDADEFVDAQNLETFTPLPDIETKILSESIPNDSSITSISVMTAVTTDNVPIVEGTVTLRKDSLRLENAKGEMNDSGGNVGAIVDDESPPGIYFKVDMNTRTIADTDSEIMP